MNEGDLVGKALLTLAIIAISIRQLKISNALYDIGEIDKKMGDVISLLKQIRNSLEKGETK